MSGRVISSRGALARLRAPVAAALLAAGAMAVDGAMAGDFFGPPVPPPDAGLVLPEMIVDPPVLPGSPVAVVRGEPRPVIYYAQPARLSPPGEPLVLPPPIPRGDRQTTLVEAAPSSLLVGPGGADRRQFVAFLKAVARGRLDALHLELRGRPAAVRAVARTAVRAGVDPLKIRVDEGAPGLVEAVASRYVALAPVCPSLAIVGPPVNANDFEPSGGCSTRANLAAMVNDPADLLGNGAVVPADGAFAARGVERYRGGGEQGGRGGGNPGTGTAVPLVLDGPLGGPILGPGGPTR